mmetsp:Transcript_18905/g.50132  ORF Transcript_18905/g.50132 Transcript_18905/m.50132 type:complete len:208 (-) Transcript_18905:380-1003(-)
MTCQADPPLHASDVPSRPKPSWHAGRSRAPRGLQLGLHGRPHHLLADRQVRHDLLAAPEDGRVLVRLLEALHVRAHARLGDGPAAKHLHRLVGYQGAGPCGLVLQERDRAAELEGLLLVGHLVHLVCDRLEERVGTLDSACHPRELLPEDGLLDQRLAKGHALCGPLEAVRDAQPAAREELGHDEPALVVEVVHDAGEALALLAAVP